MRTPERATARASVLSPRAAIDRAVRTLAVSAMTGTAAAGIHPIERAAIISRNPMMNHGTS